MTHSNSISYAERADAVGVGARAVAYAPAALTILRIGVGLLYMQHGAQKLLGLFGGVDGNGGTVQLASQFGLAGIIELGGGLLIAIGFLTRPAALVAALEMLAALFVVHLPRGGAPVQNGGELPLLYFLVFLYLASRGAGPYSVDAVFDRGRRS
ncbi:MAG: DoxX family protein [Gemmatimonadaceae bacterium]